MKELLAIVEDVSYGSTAGGVRRRLGDALAHPGARSNRVALAALETWHRGRPPGMEGAIGRGSTTR